MGKIVTGWQWESGTAAGSDPFGTHNSQFSGSRMRAVPLSQLCSLPLLAAGIAWLSSPWGVGVPSAAQCPGPALLHWLRCPSKWQNAAAPSAQPGLGKEACLGGAGTEIASFIKTSNKASRCLGRDGAWRSGMCLNTCLCLAGDSGCVVNRLVTFLLLSYLCTTDSLIT